MSKPRLILASASPRRKMLLEQVGIVPDLIDAADIDESEQKDEPPRLYALRMAREKAEKIGPKYPGDFVLTGDTVVAVGVRVLHKTADRAQARKNWQLLQGRRHTVMTAVGLVLPDGKIATKLVESVVQFVRMPDAVIDTYLDRTDEWKDKAGSYAFQGLAGLYIKGIRGNASTIIGLPVFEVASLLKSHGYHF